MKLCTLLAALAATLHAQVPAPVGTAQIPAPAGVAADTVVAKIDGKDITAGEVRKILDTTPALRSPFQQNPSLALGDFFIRQYLAGEAEKAKLDEVSPWKEQLEEQRASILTNAYVNKEANGYPVTAEMIDAYYKENQTRYEQAKIKVIFIALKPEIPSGTSPQDVQAAARAVVEGAHNQRSEADAKALATDLVKKIRDGADFSKLVAQYSEDSVSKAAGGDFGVVKSNSPYSEEIKKAVFALKPGEVSDPVRQPSGYYIVRCESRSIQPIDEVREPIIQAIRQAHLGEFIGALRQRFAAKIENPAFFQQAGANLPPAAAAPPGKP